MRTDAADLLSVSMADQNGAVPTTCRPHIYYRTILLFLNRLYIHTPSLRPQARRTYSPTVEAGVPIYRPLWDYLLAGTSLKDATYVFSSHLSRARTLLVVQLLYALTVYLQKYTRTAASRPFEREYI